MGLEIYPGHILLFAGSFALVGWLPCNGRALGHWSSPGATATFTPNPVNIGSSPAGFTMTIQTAKPIGALHRTGYFGGGTTALGLLLLPFSNRFRRNARRMKRLSLCVCVFLSFALIAGLAGCGSDSGFFGEAQQTYTINVIGTATGTGTVVLQHTTTVTLIVE